MIVYDGTKANFLKSVESDSIAVEIEENLYQKMHRTTARNEFRSWENSLEYMYKVNDKGNERMLCLLCRSKACRIFERKVIR